MIHRCPYCGALAHDDRTEVLDSTDGPILMTRWRCAEDDTHWWTASTDSPVVRRTEPAATGLLGAILRDLEEAGRAA
ncbi:MAG TPA: hypothetical protein VE646_06230 [Actinomycetota bacterium]|nr:hypothetical protein [Actinomycetota bacterium]